jgi:hypothetical protein
MIESIAPIGTNLDLINDIEYRVDVNANSEAINISFSRADDPEKVSDKIFNFIPSGFFKNLS